jgi:uncharacterized MAPEG superfamily protein
MAGGDAMKTAFVCVLIAGLLPYLGTLAAKWGFRRYDNHNPRQWLAEQTGFRARGNAAQANSFEAFPFFAAAVIISTLAQVETVWMDLFAITFVVARIGYIVCYVADKATLRSIFWLVGLLSVVALFVAALRA